MYKNFPFFIEALSTVFKKHDHLHLVCAGGGIFSASERYLFQSIGVLSRVHWFPADDATLLYLYRNAYAFVFPTLYEGFGLPVLDAFSCGCPALLSDTGSLPEIGGNAALYFDPTDKASLTATIEQILSEERLKRDLIARGRERAKLFSWEKTAAMTKKVYEAVIE
jgi:glycosyltransferase involved in cell wall biosynthesis